jgi:hypothetical protein
MIGKRRALAVGRGSLDFWCCGSAEESAVTKFLERLQVPGARPGLESVQILHLNLPSQT